MATNVEQLTYNATDGATRGRNSTEKISFYGVTPVILNTTSTGIVVTTIGAAIPAQTASASGFGASTAAIATSTFTQVAALMVDVAALQAAINIIRKNLVDLGIQLGS